MPANKLRFLKPDNSLDNEIDNNTRQVFRLDRILKAQGIDFIEMGKFISIVDRQLMKRALFRVRFKRFALILFSSVLIFSIWRLV